MPCRCDIPDPGERDLEVIKVCKLLVYVFEKTGFSAHAWVREIANKEGYQAMFDRDRDYLDDLTATLCQEVRAIDKKPALANEILWNGRSAKARSLANWWEAHLEADRIREEEEAAEAEKELTRTRALTKLSDEEREALGVV